MVFWLIADSQELKQKTLEFYESRPKGADYRAVAAYFTSQGVQVRQLTLSSVLGGRAQAGALIKVGVSKEVYKSWFGQYPAGDPAKNSLFNVYFSPKHRESVDEILRLQSDYVRTEQLRQGITPSLRRARLGVREMELLSRIGMTRTFFDDVLDLEFKDFENEIEGLRQKGKQLLEEKREELARQEKELDGYFNGLISVGHQKFSCMRKILDEQEEKVRVQSKEIASEV